MRCYLGFMNNKIFRFQNISVFYLKVAKYLEEGRKTKCCNLKIYQYIYMYKKKYYFLTKINSAK